MKTRKRLLAALAILALIGTYLAFDLGRFLSLDYFEGHRSAIESWSTARPLAAAAIYLGIYVSVTALSLPGAALMTLAGGAVFGLLWGTVIISFASTIGATLAFLIARFLLRDWVQRRFGNRLKAINEGIAKDGAFYLFTLRLVPVFPFFIINLAMALTPIRTRTYYWVSQVGMLPATLVYVNAGTHLARIESPESILSPALIGSFALLGVFPLVTRRLVGALQARKVYARWTKPRHFDRNLIVIGAGSAGLVAGHIAAAMRAKVTLIERHRMGGDCLNTGCVPSKALLRSARFLAQLGRAPEFGIRDARADFDFREVMERAQRVVRAIEPHDSIQRCTSVGMEVIEGEARIASPWTVETTNRNGRRILTTRSIVIATGARPTVPPIPGIEKAGYLTSDDVWQLRERPERLLVLGGGPVGCELAQGFARLGCRVTQVEMLPRLLSREDPEVSEAVADRLREEGVDLRPAHKAVQLLKEGEEKTLVCEDLANGEAEIRLRFDQLLVAVGRTANTSGYGLEELGIALTEHGTIRTNPFLQTNFPNIYACGDVAGPFQFTHTAAHQAWYAAINALFGGFRRFRADYSVIPWATFTEPEVARVGLNETEAKAKGIPYEVTRYGIDDLDRAITDGEAHGFVKVLTEPGKDRILGATIVGEHAADIIAELVLAMRHRIGLNKVLRTIHIYPTMAEANKYAAATWRKKHAPEGLLNWMRRYHDRARR